MKARKDRIGKTDGRIRKGLGAEKILTDRRFFRFPQTKGKRVEAVELLTAPDYHSISINFQDKTALHFQVQTGFTVKADLSDWKTGEQRILRKWPPVRSH
jgi:hypothetical protein